MAKEKCYRPTEDIISRRLLCVSVPSANETEGAERWRQTIVDSCDQRVKHELFSCIVELTLEKRQQPLASIQQLPDLVNCKTLHELHH